ncbi:hypothetical protein HYY75_04815, partial [bacterium]|nr:hypothetical protein [bacterium]
TDPSVREFYSKRGFKGFVDYLEKTYPEKFEQYSIPNHKDQNPNVIMEAISDGVVFSSLNEACCADFIAALRPKLSKLEISKAIDCGFFYIGREYDFDFDFTSEQEIVCTEFVAKSYAPGPRKSGVHFPLKDYMGKKILRADLIVEKFAKEAGTRNAELSFVYFLKGDEKAKKALVSDESTFKESFRWNGGLSISPPK